MPEEKKQFKCIYCNTDSTRRALVLIEHKKKLKAVCTHCFKSFAEENFV